MFHLEQGFAPTGSTTNETGCTLTEPGNVHAITVNIRNIIAFVPPEKSKDQAEDKEDPADDDESDTEPEETKVAGLGQGHVCIMPTLALGLTSLFGR